VLYWHKIITQQGGGKEREEMNTDLLGETISAQGRELRGGVLRTFSWKKKGGERNWESFLENIFS